jgi:uncharacterized protein (TIGR03118 family)
MRNSQRLSYMFKSLSTLSVVVALTAVPRVTQAELFKTMNLVTDDPAAHPAQITDPSLINAWGMSFSPTSPLWVSANGSGRATVYNVNANSTITKQSLEVSIPGNGSVTGQVFNGTAAFNGNRFLFVSEDGTVSGWRGALGTNAEVLQTPSTANYKGVALAANGANTYLYAANFQAGTIDVLKGDVGAPDLGGNFTDPGLPFGYAPFNIQLLGGRLYVAYAVQGAGGDEQAGQGLGIVSAFDTNGSFVGRVGPTDSLNAPWGLAIAPDSFGSFAGDLLVGNFGDGTISAFDLAQNTFVGQLAGLDGNPLMIDGLWGLTPGNDGAAGSADTIYFTAGPDDESHGLLGALNAVPEPSSLMLALVAVGMFTARGAFTWIRRHPLARR